MNRLSAGHRAGIRHLNIEFCFAFGIVRFFRFDFKICIRQTESEFIQHLFGGEGFKIAVTHKDVLNIVVVFLCAEAAAARVVLISFCDCIAELSARSDFTGEYIRKRVSALHTALPSYKYRAYFILICIYLFKINKTAYIENQNDVVKMSRDKVKHLLFSAREVIAALFENVFAILSGASAYEYHGLIALFGCAFYNVVFKRHFRIKSRPMSPKPRIRYVFALAAPIIINFSEIFVYMYFSVFFYAVGKADFIRRAYVSARAVADKKAVVLHSAEQRDIILAVYGQSPVVFQQYAAVRRCLSQKRDYFLIRLAVFYYARILLLRKLTAADFTNQFIYNPTHFTAPFLFLCHNITY